MAKMVKVKPTLMNAGSVKIVWEKNPDFKLGNIGFSDFIALYDATDALDKDYTKKDVELNGIRDICGYLSLHRRTGFRNRMNLRLNEMVKRVP